MDNHFTTIVSACRAQLEKTPSFLELFDSTFRDHLASFDMSDFLNSGCTIAPQSNVSALQHACQTVSQAISDAASTDSTSSSSFLVLSTTLWNPVLAAIVANLSQQRPAPDLALAGQSRSYAQVSSTSSKTNQQPQPRPPYRKDVKNPPPSQKSRLPSYDRDVSLRELEAYLGNKQLHFLFPTFKRCCGKRSCDRCVEMFQTIPLTACASMHGNVSCVPSGWFPHMTGSLWNKIAGAHNKADVWKWKAPQIREGQQLNPLQVGALSSATSDLSLGPTPQVSLCGDELGDWSEEVDRNCPLSAVPEVAVIAEDRSPATPPYPPSLPRTRAKQRKRLGSPSALTQTKAKK